MTSRPASAAESELQSWRQQLPTAQVDNDKGSFSAGSMPCSLTRSPAPSRPNLLQSVAWSRRVLAHLVTWASVKMSHPMGVFGGGRAQQALSLNANDHEQSYCYPNPNGANDGLHRQHPEDRLERSDSKNPKTTCKGLTGAGNLCRNPVTPVKGKTLSPTLKEESLYCHHHKDQAASRSAQSSPGPRLSGRPILEERTSIDTLADRLGLVDVGSNPSKKHKRPQGGRPSGGRPQPTGSKPSAAYTRPPKKDKELHFCFCFKVPIDEVQESQPAPRPQPRPVQNGGSAAMPRPSSQLLSPSNGRPRPSTSSHSRKSSQPSPQPLSTSQTAQYLSLIPRRPIRRRPRR
ncbi:hypothetical protein ColLi_10026 [Colletotrichum liriopes]|uniref:Uncharacterized protein n=1 Tax=Colletotrichum liriopes TaxID=708192 RepID=A0AA37GW35_9PEZI|nr:hypothetical protein ColLi_10026 [Colletotrichum liriopes]